MQRCIHFELRAVFSDVRGHVGHSDLPVTIWQSLRDETPSVEDGCPAAEYGEWACEPCEPGVAIGTDACEAEAGLGTLAARSGG